MRRKGLGKGLGKGYKNLVPMDSHIHALSAKGVKTKKSWDMYAMKVEYAPMEPFRIDNSYYTMQKNEDGTYNLSLGNLSDAGWYWTGDEGDMNGFIIRLNNSAVKEDFLEDVERTNVPFAEFKKYLKPSIERGDGIYMITGDNVLWHFGQYEPDLDAEWDYVKEQNGFTEAEREAWEDEFWDEFNFDYDEYTEHYTYKGLKDSMLAALERSETLEEYMNEIDGMGQEGLEASYVYLTEKTTEASNEAAEEVLAMRDTEEMRMKRAQSDPSQTRLQASGMKERREEADIRFVPRELEDGTYTIFDTVTGDKIMLFTNEEAIPKLLDDVKEAYVKQTAWFEKDYGEDMR